MNMWTRVMDIRLRLRRMWDKGVFLRTRISGEELFPLRLILKHPTPRELAERFAQAQEWIAAIGVGDKSETGSGYEVEWREINHRQLGRNRLAVAVQFESESDVLAFLGKQKQADAFSRLVENASRSCPEIMPWLARYPLRALEHLSQWPQHMAVLDWLRRNPRPGIYIRQMEIPDVDTKFIETNRKLLCELLDMVLPESSIDRNAEAGAFERRYGFKEKPALIRFRLLDPDLYLKGLSDLAIPAEQFARLHLPVQQVFIMENEINGLAFPGRKKSLVIFGLGYGLDRLAAAEWLRAKQIWYWGDIDTHGFAMLDQVRHYFPATQSLLMDRETLLKHRALWVTESSPTQRELSGLTEAELALYNDLRRDRLGPRIRLEQERIDFRRVKSALGA